MLRFIESIKRYKNDHLPLYRFSLLILFWAIADGIASFSFPIFLQRSLKDLTAVGLVFGSSSLFGLMADLFWGSEQKGKTFKPYFLTAAVCAAAAYIIAISANTIIAFLLIMALWGFYYEAINFTIIDFLSRFTKRFEHAQSSGIVQMFFSLGYLLAPIIASPFIINSRASMIPALFFVVLSFFAFIIWFALKPIKADIPTKKLTFLQELKIWIQVGKKGFWVLASLFLLNLWDSLIWSMGPIYLLSSFKGSSAYIISCFVIPRVFLQGYAGRWADKRGKESQLTSGLAIAGIFICFFSLQTGLFLKILFALLSAVGASLVWPASDGLFIDMIDGYKDEEEEIAGVRGFSSNLGYIIGPILAGFLGNTLGLQTTFCIFGMVLIFGAGFIRIFWKIRKCPK